MSYLFYGNIAAAEFIPAAVAALLFFVYPPLTTLLAAALDKRPPSPLKVFATLIAFCGLAVMLGIGFQELDWRGLLLGLSAGCVCAIQLTWVARALSGHDPLVTMTQMALVAAIILSIATVSPEGCNYLHLMLVGVRCWRLQHYKQLQSLFSTLQFQLSDQSAVQ